MRFLVTLVFVVLLPFTTTMTLGAMPVSPSMADAPVVLAAVLSLTGPYASVGRQEEIALKVAIATVNATGGVDGRPAVLDMQDDHSSPADAIAAARILMRTSHPAAIIGGSYDATCTAISQLTDEDQMVQYCLSGTTSMSPTFFSSFPAPGRAFGDLPAAWMHRAGFKDVAIISSNDRAGRLYSSAMVAASLGQQLTVVANEHFQERADVAGVVATVLAARPKVIYVGTASAGAAVVLKELQRRRVRTPVWLVSADATRASAKALASFLPPGPVFSSATKLALYENLSPNDPQRALLERFTAAFAVAAPGESPDIFAAIAADAAEFLVAALRADRGVGGLVLAQTIERTPRAPGLYAWYHFSPEAHNGTELPGAIVRFRRDGELQYIMTLEDADVPAYAHVTMHRSPRVRRQTV